MKPRFINVPRVPGALDAVLEGLTGLNATIMASPGAKFPLLYEADVWWMSEPVTVEDWYNVAEVLRRRDEGLGSDCEDLAAYRAAELRVFLGEPAQAVAVAIRPGHYHAVVRRADGTLEDPSRICGKVPKRGPAVAKGA